MKLNHVIEVNGIKRIVVKRLDGNVSKIYNRNDNRDWVEEKSGKVTLDKHMSSRVRKWCVPMFAKYRVWIHNETINVEKCKRF